MKSKKLEQLFEELQNKYEESEKYYQMSGAMTIEARGSEVEMCNYFLKTINKVYGTKYEFRGKRTK